MTNSDTQWPRYQVFLQEKRGAPHHDVGSVHAPDPEIALQNARDVFVRRPECVNLWVVPADAILSITADELGAWRAARASSGRRKSASPDSNQPVEKFFIFCKTKPAGTQTLTGTVEAATPEQALEVAIELFSGDHPPFVWWVFPEKLVFQTEPEDIDSMFAPSLDKSFRLSTDFHTVSAMRQIRSTTGETQGEARG